MLFPDSPAPVQEERNPLRLRHTINTPPYVLLSPHRCPAKLTYHARELLSRYRLKCLYTLLTPTVCSPSLLFSYLPRFIVKIYILSLSPSVSLALTDINRKIHVAHTTYHAQHLYHQNMRLFSIRSVSLQNTKRLSNDQLECTAPEIQFTCPTLTLLYLCPNPNLDFHCCVSQQEHIKTGD